MRAWNDSSFHRGRRGGLCARRGGAFGNSGHRMRPSSSPGGIFFLKILSGSERFRTSQMRAGVTVQSPGLKPQAFFATDEHRWAGIGTRLSEAYPAALMAGLEAKDGRAGVVLSRARTQTDHLDGSSAVFNAVGPRARLRDRIDGDVDLSPRVSLLGSSLRLQQRES